MTTSAERRRWQCPSCERTFKIPVSSKTPKLCPECWRGIEVLRQRSSAGATGVSQTESSTDDASAELKDPPPVNVAGWSNRIRCWVDARPRTAMVLLVTVCLSFIGVSIWAASEPFRPAALDTPVASTSDTAHDKRRELQKPDKPKAQFLLSAAQLYARAKESVVVIRSIRSKDGSLDVLGSGFVLAPDNVIVTNEHVIRGAFELRIETADGREASVNSVVVVDSDRDLAVLPLPHQLRVPPIPQLEMPGLKMAGALPSIGETVYAIGAPKGLDYSLSKGIVSQIRRNVLGSGTLVQTDASISHGSSGGPLLNGKGEIVGVNRMSRTGGQNLNFAVAAKELNKLRPFIGTQQLVELPGYKKFQTKLEQFRRKSSKAQASVEGELKKIGQLEARRLAEAEKIRKAAEKHLKELKKRGVQARNQAELNRMNNRLLELKAEVALIDRNITSLVAARGTTMGLGKAAYVAGVRVRNDIIAIRSRLATVSGAIQRRQTYLNGGHVPIDNEAAGYNTAGLLMLDGEQSSLRQRLAFYTRRAQSLEASITGLDLKARSLLRQIRAKLAQRSVKVYEYGSIVKQYNSLLSATP
ncbi:MAG: trypsin-like peptidase domain-containing protein [Planctomycetaceae bacterium]